MDVLLHLMFLLRRFRFLLLLLLLLLLVLALFCILSARVSIEFNGCVARLAGYSLWFLHSLCYFSLRTDLELFPSRNRECCSVARVSESLKPLLKKHKRVIKLLSEWIARNYVPAPPRFSLLRQSLSAHSTQNSLRATSGLLNCS